MKFKADNQYSRGRPKGARNRLAAQVFADALAHWNEPAKEGSALTKGQAALQMLFRESPRDYVRLYFALMPRELQLDTNIVTELDDVELDRMIEMLRERVREERLAAEPAPLALTALKVLPNAH
jgi:hypothetical protein